MLSQVEQIRKFLENRQKAIQTNIRAKGKHATGKTERDLVVTVDRTGGSLTGPAYIDVLESGRPPTKNHQKGPGPGLRLAILEWIKAKGIQADIPDESLSWAIATTIHRKGDLLYRTGLKSGVLSEVINEEVMKRFLNDFYGTEVLRVKIRLAEHWQKTSPR